jgi:hypothetical protein
MPVRLDLPLNKVLVRSGDVVVTQYELFHNQPIG